MRKQIWQMSVRSTACCFSVCKRTLSPINDLCPKHARKFLPSPPHLAIFCGDARYGRLSSAGMTHAQPSGRHRERYDRLRVPPFSDAHPVADVASGLGRTRCSQLFATGAGGGGGWRGDERPLNEVVSVTCGRLIGSSSHHRCHQVPWTTSLTQPHVRTTFPNPIRPPAAVRARP